MHKPLHQAHTFCHRADFRYRNLSYRIDPRIDRKSESLHTRYAEVSTAPHKQAGEGAKFGTKLLPHLSLGSRLTQDVGPSFLTSLTLAHSLSSSEKSVLKKNFQTLLENFSLLLSSVPVSF